MAEIEADFTLEETKDVLAEFSIEETEDIQSVFEINVLSNIHNILEGRDAEDCHPISAITGLSGELSTLQQNINNEKTRAEGVESDIRTAIGDEEARAKGVEEELNEAIQETAGSIKNGVLTIQKNGTTVQTFSANQESDATANLIIPTKTSDITNDSDFATNSDVSTAVSNHNTSESAHSYIQGLISAEVTRAEGVEGTLSGLTTDTKTNLVAAINEVDSHTDTNTSDITTINSKIPNDASSSNQLADKQFVNSSISTNTANFIGTFDSITELNNYSGTVTNNDYAFVVNGIITDSGNDWATFADLDDYDKSLLTNFDYAWVVHGSNFDLYRFDIVEQEWGLRAENITKDSVTLNAAYNRYKANVTTDTPPVMTWLYEYTLNNSSFTATQWAAINSGATTGLINQITTNENAIGTLSSLNTSTKTDLVSAINEVNTNKVDANTAITGATYTKITYDSKGLVTGGTSLSASDIPSLTLSKISDVTATASEVNVLDGITASTTELNYLDGVTSSVQTQIDGKVPTSRTVNGKELSSDISLTYSDVGALPDSTTIGNATLTIQKNGTTIDTFTANATSNKTINIAVPTDTSDLTNGAGYITSSALNGYATQTWVGQQGFLTSTALANYVTTNTSQTITGQKTFLRTETQFQDSVARFVSTYNSSTQGWRGRVIIGAKDYTFLIGTYNSMAALCGHKFTDSSTEAGANWSDIYFSPDGDKAIYFGGWSWTQNSGWFKVKNNASNTSGQVQVNKGSITNANWKDVAYKGENISDFTNNSGFITSASVGNATLKIQKNGTDVASFTANSSTNATANITVPTDTNDLTNGAGYITGITSSDVTTALGYTPYDANNPNGYTSNTGTVTSVNNVDPVGGNVTISIPTVDQSYDGTSANAQSGVAVKSAIDAAISSVYKPAGSVAFASLPALSSSIEGYVYNVTDSFTTTSDFVEGAGKTYPAGTNVVCIDVGSSVYKWDVLSGMVDLSGYVPTSRTINNKALTSNISLTASDVGALPDSTVIPTVNNATLTIQKNGTNVATFTANSSSNSTANITVPTQASDVGAVEANASITGATKCKITYDSKGLVTGGADLQASDIPSLTLSKISDITATASEVNVLDGITASTTELNYLDGVTSSIQTQLNGKVPNTRTVNGKALSSDVDLTYSDVDALSDSTKFGADLSYSGNQLQLLDQDGNALGNAQTIKSSPDLDGKSITKNSSDELQTVGVIDQNDTTTALKQWSGTKAQYDAIVSKDANTVYNITDDTNPTQALLEAIYPVGSIYIGTMNVCPMSALFGTWTKVAEDRVLQGAGTRGSVGTTVNESLPNITGRLDFICVGNTQNNLGAFSQSVRESDVNKNTILNGGENMINLGIDASRSSSTYQDSAPVQQDAYLVNIWQRTQ